MKKINLRPLSQKQHTVIIFLSKQIRKSVIAPRLTDYCKYIDKSTESSIASLLKGLEKKWYIENKERKDEYTKNWVENNRTLWNMYVYERYDPVKRREIYERAKLNSVKV